MAQILMQLCLMWAKIATTRSQPVGPKVAAFMGKVECKEYLQAVWNFMTREQHMHIRKL